LLCHNPGAGTSGYDKEGLLAALKLADMDVRYVAVKSDDLDSALKKSSDLVVVAGGDGTIDMVLTMLHDRSVPVALFPLGTANNAARSLGIAGTPQELVETWEIERTCPLDIGTVKGPWGTSRFVEGFGVGVFAAFLREAAKRNKAEGADNLRKGRALLQKVIKASEPVDIGVSIDGRAVSGEFIGVEVMNIPFTGPSLPIAAKADVCDGMLDVIFFEAGQRKALIEWLEAPLDAPPPVTARRGHQVELTWTDAPNRIDDEAYENKDRKLAVEIALENEQVHILVPRRHPAQQDTEAKLESA
jgi:diacylglycerol kinase family enzyme